MKCPNSGTKFKVDLLGHVIFNIPTMQFGFGIPQNTLSKFIYYNINIPHYDITDIQCSSSQNSKLMHCEILAIS